MKEKLIYELTDRGYTLKAWYHTNGKDAIVEITKGEKLVSNFTFPAYKIYNISAHFNDIVDTEIYNSLPRFVRNPNYKNGYQMAAWNGF